MKDIKIANIIEFSFPKVYYINRSGNYQLKYVFSFIFRNRNNNSKNNNNNNNSKNNKNNNNNNNNNI